MNLYELVKHLRTSILDDKGGYGIAWEDIEEDGDEAILLRWSNEELTIFINEALRKAARSTGVLKDIQASFNIDIVSGTNVYDLDNRIIRIKHNKLVSTGLPLEIKEIEEVEDISDWDEVNGTPASLLVDYTLGKIALYPNPDTNDTLKLWTIREELNPLEWDKNTKSPELPERYHISMLNYAAYLAFLKDEANTYDPAKSDRFLTMFVRDFDDTSAHSEIRRARNGGRTVRYGGL